MEGRAEQDNYLQLNGRTPLMSDASMAAADKLTLAQLCEELQISRSTFYDWRAKGRAPRCIRLPNGDLRIRRADLDRWLDRLQDAS